MTARDICPSGEPCIRHLCKTPGCFRERLRADGFCVVNGVLTAIAGTDTGRADHPDLRDG